MIALLTVMAVFLAITVKRKRQRDRAQAELQDAKDRFFTSLTHELRTPLTVIQSAAQNIIKQSSRKSVIYNDASNIIWYSSIILNIINNILDTTKMVSGNRLKLDWKHGDIVPFITMVCESYSLYASDKDITIEYKPEEKSVAMDFVPEYLHKVLQNLISNSIKFSYPGSRIDIISRIEQDFFVIYVTDKGKGMTPEQKSNIFKAFYQAEDDGPSGLGSGVGLPLAKLLLDSTGGNIEAVSSIDEGSTFIVKLPLEYKTGTEIPLVNGNWENEDKEMPESRLFIQDDAPAEGDGVQILIVEDSPVVAHYISKQLNSGYQFFYAKNGDEGFTKANELVPDLIITDILMPGGGTDGLELCRKIRSSELLHHIPIVIVSARGSHQDMIKGLEAGADAYIEKPFQADELRIRVEKLMEQREILREKYIREIDGDGAGNFSSFAYGDRVFINRFAELARTRIKANDVDLNALAEELGLSRTQLNRKVKAITGLTTTAYIMSLRVRLAKSLLRDNASMPINEVAFQCGIEDVPYFITMFKKATGMTPAYYRRKCG